MNNHARGYTLIELIVAVGLFAFIMTIVSGAYIVMIGLVRHTQAMASGIDNLSFALESMTRSIRTGTGYGCGAPGVDCPNGGTAFFLTDMNGHPVSYGLSGSAITETTISGSYPLTDASAVQISSLTFYVSGTRPFSAGNTGQPYATIVVSGTVPSGGVNDPPQSFTVETSAVMRGTDL